jgi:glycogen synthase
MLAPVNHPSSEVRKIALTTDAVGGVWTYTLDLAKALAASGIEVELIVLGPAPALHQQHDVAAIPGIRLSMFDLPLDWTVANPSELKDASAALFALMRTLGGDLIHLNSPGLAIAATDDVPLVLGLHSCVTSWWQAVRPGEPMPADLTWRHGFVSRALSSADAVIVPSRSFGDTARRIYGESIRILPIHNGRRSAGNRHSAEDKDTSLVLTAGRLWDEAKGAATLDAAAGLMSRPIHAAGQLADPMTGATSAQVDNLKTLGTLPAQEMRSWFERAGIFVSAARYEPFGLGVLEAAQVGSALVLSDIDTFRELWNDAALFVPPGDPAAFADAIETLIAEPRRQTELGACARRRAEAYTIDRMVAETSALYAELVAHHVPRSILSGATA